MIIWKTVGKSSIVGSKEYICYFLDEFFYRSHYTIYEECGYSKIGYVIYNSLGDVIMHCDTHEQMILFCERKIKLDLIWK